MAALTLPEIIDSKGARVLARQLLERRGGDLVLDGRAVERLGGLGVEVLLAARLQWRADGACLTVSAWSEPARSALETLGCGADLSGAEG